MSSEQGLPLLAQAMARMARDATPEVARLCCTLMGGVPLRGLAKALEERMLGKCAIALFCVTVLYRAAPHECCRERPQHGPAWCIDSIPGG